MRRGPRMIITRMATIITAITTTTTAIITTDGRERSLHRGGPR